LGGWGSGRFGRKKKTHDRFQPRVFVESHLASTIPSGTGKYYGYYRYAKGLYG